MSRMLLGFEPCTQQQPTPVPKAVGGPPSIIITPLNLLKFQGALEPFMRVTSEFRTTRNGIKVVKKHIVDYSALMRHLVKPVKAVIRPLPGDTPAEDISNELAASGYSVFSVRRMTYTRPKHQDGLQT